MDGLRATRRRDFAYDPEVPDTSAEAHTGAEAGLPPPKLRFRRGQSEYPDRFGRSKGPRSIRRPLILFGAVAALTAGIWFTSGPSKQNDGDRLVVTQRADGTVTKNWTAVTPDAPASVSDRAMPERLMSPAAPVTQPTIARAPQPLTPDMPPSPETSSQALPNGAASTDPQPVEASPPVPSGRAAGATKRAAPPAPTEAKPQYASPSTPPAPALVAVPRPAVGPAPIKSAAAPVQLGAPPRPLQVPDQARPAPAASPPSPPTQLDPVRNSRTLQAPTQLTQHTAPLLSAAQSPSPPAPQSAASAGTARYRIQLASYRSEDMARAAADRMRAQFAVQLCGLDFSVTKADLGDKGVFYRIMSEPTDEPRARSICSALKVQDVGCMFVKQHSKR